MKKIISTLLAVFVLGITITGCSSKGGEDKNVKPSDIVKTIKEKIELRAMMPIEEELAKEKIHLNLDDVEEYSIENGMINSGLEVIAVIKAKDGKVESVKTSLEKVIEDKKAAAFYPGEPEAVEAAKVKIVGNYVGLFIIPDYEDGQNNSENAAKIFEEALK
ncbi:hypothetical protein JCM1393_02410 [Clostridium carnis]